MTMLRRRSRKLITGALATVVALTVAGCSILPFEKDCTDDLRIHLTPRDTSVAVGASFQARVSLSTCGGSKRLSDTFTWTSLDPDVVQVVAATGRITAVGRGETTVTPVGARYGAVAEIRIVVAP